MQYLNYPFILLLLVLNFLPTQINAQCNHPDYNALIKLYNNTDGANWKDNSGWKEGAAGTNCAPCTWKYIKCTSNRVTEINFSSGTGLKGTLPPEIGQLTELKSLNINREPNLKGALPTELGSLKKMQILKIRSTGITGEIPPGIFQSNLSQLFLSRNQLSGTIPDEVGNAGNITLLFLNYNMLSGAIPESIYSLRKVTDLFINDNQLTGQVSPSIAQLRNLSRMSFGANQLTGSIPEEIGTLRNLSVIKFYQNKMSGPLPMSIKNLRNLDEIKINDNQFSGWIIGELAVLKKLTQIQMQDNQFECFDETLKTLCATGQLKRSSFENNKNPLNWQEFCDNNDYPYICNVAANTPNASALHLYPNPTQDYIALEGAEDLKVRDICLIDNSGHIVLRPKYANNLIDISNLSNGLYFLKINTDKGTFTRKVFRQ